MSSKLESLKKAFQNQTGLIHLNNAGLAPSSPEAHDIVVYWMDRFRREGMHCNDAYLAAVFQERRRELYSEGFLFYDLVRIDKAIALPNIKNKDQYLLPLPGAQIKLSNGILIQNKGY